jgi:FAD/FMN-containing dehydrogenase
MSRMQAIELFRSVLEKDAVLTGEAISTRYLRDASGLASGCPLAVLLPRSVDQISAILRMCHSDRIGVVPQGGMTGLAGGAVPTTDTVCLSLERFRGIEEIDRTAATMTVRAGTTLEEAHLAARDAGFEFPYDMGSRGSCQIGGTLATNAGGIRVIQSGTARQNVLGLEVVLADGTVLSSMRPLLKNNTGYDLKQLFIGSEGTLGIISRAVVRLLPKPRTRCTALCGLNSFADALELLRTLRSSFGKDLAAFEVMWPHFFDFGVQASRSLSPFGRSFAVYALVEQTSFDPVETAERFTELLSDSLSAGIVADAVIPHSTAETRALWAIREASAHFSSRFDALNLDISVPIADMGRFVDECQVALRDRWGDHPVFYFGHIGDCNLHITVDRCRFGGKPQEVEGVIYALVEKFRGTISAEHGIGLFKRNFLHYSRSPAEIAAMRAIKKALDPNGILNPGKLLPDIDV